MDFIGVTAAPDTDAIRKVNFRGLGFVFGGSDCSWHIRGGMSCASSEQYGLWSLCETVRSRILIAWVLGKCVEVLHFENGTFGVSMLFI